MALFLLFVLYGNDGPVGQPPFDDNFIARSMPISTMPLRFTHACRCRISFFVSSELVQVVVLRTCKRGRGRRRSLTGQRRRG